MAATRSPSRNDLVFVLVTVNAQRNGLSASFPEIHVWRMKNGKATDFREYQGDEQREDPLLLSVYTSQVYHTLSLDKSDHLRHDQHVHMIQQKMTFLDSAFLLLTQFPEYISQVPTQF